jgi:hypothetical protein
MHRIWTNLRIDDVMNTARPYLTLRSLQSEHASTCISQLPQLAFSTKCCEIPYAYEAKTILRVQQQMEEKGIASCGHVGEN